MTVHHLLMDAAQMQSCPLLIARTFFLAAMVARYLTQLDEGLLKKLKRSNLESFRVGEERFQSRIKPAA